MSDQVCVIIGANQAGVTAAFALREEGWQGGIVLYDADPTLPYERPPLSKVVLTGAATLEEHTLKPAALYEREHIELHLGVRVTAVDRAARTLSADDGSVQSYDKLVLATGARPIWPAIPGMDAAKHVFTIRTAQDAADIRETLAANDQKRVVVIGGGYIGLETAASLKKLGADVVVLEREERVLARVTAPEMSTFFQELHANHGVDIHVGSNVERIDQVDGHDLVVCADGSSYAADLIIVGVGIHVNQELADACGLETDNGIRVDATTRTSDEHIYAIGDCTRHHNPIYDRDVRLESVQNASDQAKVAAATICGKDVSYKAVPWFWSDQYDVKLQMVGLSEGYTQTLRRDEPDKENSFSVWYFKNERLLAVDAVNDTKAYVIGTKFIKTGKVIDQAKLMDTTIPFKPASLLAE